jgi:hypothetical protein
MTWFEDDSQVIPEYIKNMTREEKQAILRKYEEDGKKRKLARQQQNTRISQSNNALWL